MKLEFSKFTEIDWELYSGCESKDPMICEFILNDIEYCVILDIDCVNVFHHDHEDDSIACYHLPVFGSPREIAKVFRTFQQSQIVSMIPIMDQLH